MHFAFPPHKQINLKKSYDCGTVFSFLFLSSQLIVIVFLNLPIGKAANIHTCVSACVCI